MYPSISLVKPPFADMPISVRFRPFPSVERNLNGMWLPGNARIVELEFDYGSAFFS